MFLNLIEFMTIFDCLKQINQARNINYCRSLENMNTNSLRFLFPAWKQFFSRFRFIFVFLLYASASLALYNALQACLGVYHALKVLENTPCNQPYYALHASAHIPAIAPLR